MNSLSSIGFIGSWCWSCATRSFRKSSLPMTADFVAAAVAAACWVPVTDVMSAMSLVLLGEHVHEHALGERHVGRLVVVVVLRERAVAVAALGERVARPAAVALLIRRLLPHVEGLEVHSGVLQRTPQVGARVGERLR